MIRRIVNHTAEPNGYNMFPGQNKQGYYIAAVAECLLSF